MVVNYNESNCPVELTLLILERINPGLSDISRVTDRDLAQVSVSYICSVIV